MHSEVYIQLRQIHSYIIEILEKKKMNCFEILIYVWELDIQIFIVNFPVILYDG